MLTGKRGGPVHVIACHKTATESQAARLLGFPDATLVSAPFGIFAADPVQKVQFAFITNLAMTLIPGMAFSGSWNG